MSTTPKSNRTTHTLGPWSVEHHGGPWHIFGASDERVGTFTPSLVSHNEEAFQHETANAHLIAAAPELLEYALLEEAVEEFDCPHDAEARCDCGPRHDAMFRRARELRKRAIAKAEGR